VVLVYLILCLFAANGAYNVMTICIISMSVRQGHVGECEAEYATSRTHKTKVLLQRRKTVLVWWHCLRWACYVCAL